MPKSRIRCIALVSLLVPLAASASSKCDRVLQRLGDRLTGATCFESTDLTTNNSLTTPADNSIATLPAFAFTPQTDRSKIAPSASKRPPITKVVPGVQISAYIAGDPTGQARFLLRLPDDWNGRLVVAGASGTRSEFNGDYAWSDYVIQKGYAYASQNKGVLNLRLTAVQVAPPNALACRLAASGPTSVVWVNFYDNDPGQPFARWAMFMGEAAKLAKRGVEARYGQKPRFTYAVGTSNGGYQTRRAVELFPDLFDGGVDWEGTYVDDHDANLLTDLPPGILNYPDYAASGFNATSTAAKNIQLAGYPPDIVQSTGSLWANYWGDFWEVTQCQWQKRLDPTYDTYVQGTGTYNYRARLAQSDVGQQLESFETTGRIHRPLITVAGTMDALLPIDHHARAYARRVEAALQDNDGDDRHDHDHCHDRPAYRLYEVQNGNHIETYQDTFTALELIEPHAQHAFDLLVDQVEHGQALPPSQCIPRGGNISSSPAQPGHCTAYFVP